MSSFSERLKELRASKGLTQAEVAKPLGVAPSTYSLYESGKREPNFETLLNISLFFNVDVDFLLSGKNSIQSLTDALNKTEEFNTIAAHFDGDEFTEAELEEIKQFAEFVKNRRK